MCVAITKKGINIQWCVYYISSPYQGEDKGGVLEIYQNLPYPLLGKEGS
jgi:hypothetical protein